MYGQVTIVRTSRLIGSGREKMSSRDDAKRLSITSLDMRESVCHMIILNEGLLSLHTILLKER